MFSLAKKHKIIYGCIMVILFLDLFSFGHYYEQNIKNEYLAASFKNYGDLQFLEEEKEHYRFFSNVFYMAHLRIIPNMNIHCGLYSVADYDPLVLGNYHYMTKIPDNPAVIESFHTILKNNLVISK